MTLDEFDQLSRELNDSIDTDEYFHLPAFGDDVIALDGAFTAKELRQIADAADKLKEAWKQVEGKDKLAEWIMSKKQLI